ncbi:MAG: hypothetical protein ACK2T4_13615 [Candidatus Promineifilaceae bacterium]|jgi:hypothetical protein
MNDEEYQLGRQRLAWAFLIGSFSICLLISITIPVAVNAYIRNATRDLITTIQANEGTVGVDNESGVRRAVIAGENEEFVESGSSILTDATATALLHVMDPNQEELFARLTIDGNSTVRIEQAIAPRFNWSNVEIETDYQLESGRLRVNLLDPETDTPPLTINFLTPQGTVTINEPGQYAVEVNNQATQLNVYEGMAAIMAEDESLMLQAGERAEIPTGSVPRGPLNPERNLIKNGDFSEGFNNWAQYAWLVELDDQPEGKTEVTRLNGEPVLRFERNGIGHADARVTQSLNQSVSDFESLRLMLTLRIVEQSLGVCGIQGSECPLFVRVNYIDENGVSQTWQQGFFASGEIDDNMTPGACVSCALIQKNHERAQLGQEFFFEIDLREELARQGAAPPRQIESISLIASGHSFITDVMDVTLIVN